jgi:hypothetical protein
LQRTSAPSADLFRGGLGGTVAFMVIMTAIFISSVSESRVVLSRIGLALWAGTAPSRAVLSLFLNM